MRIIIACDSRRMLNLYSYLRVVPRSLRADLLKPHAFFCRNLCIVYSRPRIVAAVLEHVKFIVVVASTRGNTVITKLLCECGLVVVL